MALLLKHGAQSGDLGSISSPVADLLLTALCLSFPCLMHCGTLTSLKCCNGKSFEYKVL